MLDAVGVRCPGKACPRCGDQARCPPALIEGTAYLRQITDLVWAKNSVQVRSTIDDDDPFEFWVSGVFYHQKDLQRLCRGASSRCQAHLVPEPGNWFDPCAVAVDVSGSRIGYLSSTIAAKWHDVIRMLNLQGCRVMADVTLIRDPASGYEGVDVAARMTLPGWDARRRLDGNLALDKEFRALCNALPAADFETLTGASWEHLESSDVMLMLFNQRKHMPSLQWDRLLVATHRAFVPARLLDRLKEEVRVQRRQRYEQRQEIRNVERRKRQNDVAALHASGKSKRDIADELGCSVWMVTTLLREHHQRTERSEGSIS